MSTISRPTVNPIRPSFEQMVVLQDPTRFKVLACGRRWGKTTLGIIHAVEMMTRGRLVWWVSPTYPMAGHVWDALKRATDPLGAERRKLEAEHLIEMPGRGGAIMGRSAARPDSLRGYGLDGLVIDDAAFVREEVWTAALRPALSDRKGSALLLSTPCGRNWFWEAYLRGRDRSALGWRSWRFPTAANPRIDSEEIEEARRLLPERVFRQEYLAEFLEDGGEVFRRVRVAATASADSPPAPGHRYVMGVDWGRRDDFTALAVIDATTRQMVALDRFTSVEWATQRGRLAALARRWGVEDILAEANAMGEPNIEALRREGLPIQGFTTTAVSKPPLIESLALAIETEELALLPDETLLGELEAYTYQTLPSGRPRYGAPPGLHDDTVIALALAWKLAAAPRLTLAIVEV